jgi:uncharacterized protein
MATLAEGEDLAERASAIDWGRVSQDLDAHGSAVLEQLLSPDECRSLAALYPEDSVFRSRVVMARHGFGRGEYKYFNYPLPEVVAELRTSLYPHLAPIANRWNAAIGTDVRYPPEHAEFIARCHAAGQRNRRRSCSSMRPTTTTASTRTCTASTCSRCRWLSCSLIQGKTLRAVSSS